MGSTRCYGCSQTEHTHPCEASPAPSLWHSAVLGNDELQPSLLCRPLECQHVDVTLHTRPQAVGGYQGDNLAEPQLLVMVSQLHSFEWELQEIPVPTEAVCSVSIPVQGLWGKRRVHQHMHWQTHVPVLFMKSYELKSICRSGVLWVPKENPLTDSCIIPAVY